MRHITDSTVINGRLSEIYAIINNQRLFFGNAQKFEAHVTITSMEIKPLGTTIVYKKPISASGSWTADAFFNTSRFPDFALQMLKNNQYPDLEFICILEDPATIRLLGRQVISLYGARFEGDMPVFMTSNEDSPLTVSVQGSFSSMDLPERFNQIDDNF